MPCRPWLPHPSSRRFRFCSHLRSWRPQGYLAIGRNFANLLETPFLPYCLLGAFCIHMATRPGLKERLWTVALGAVSIACFVVLSGKFRPTWSGVIACGAFPGLSSLAVMAVQVLRLRGKAQNEKLNTLLAGSVFGYSALLIAAVLNLTTRLHPQTYDLYLSVAGVQGSWDSDLRLDRPVPGTRAVAFRGTCALGLTNTCRWR